MAIAASLEAWRLAVAARGGPPVSVFALALPYALVGVSEVCVFIGLMEMCYSESPDSMRSLASALQLLTGALGSFLSSAIVAAVEAGGRAYSASGRGWLPDTDEGYQGRLDLFYTLLMAISAANLAFFAYVASCYQYKVLADPSVRAGRGGLSALRAAEAGAGRAGVAGTKEVGAVGAASAAGRL
jgi:peptide/histidine transporter 3/4